MFLCCTSCVLYSCCTFFRVALFSCCNYFHVAAFFMLHFFCFGPSFSTRFLFYSFHGALFCCCFSSHCALFILHSSMSHSFHVESFISSTFLVLYFFHKAFPMAIFHSSLTSCCGLLRLYFFILRFFHVAHFHKQVIRTYI